jgi:hypothetical protein
MREWEEVDIGERSGYVKVGCMAVPRRYFEVHAKVQAEGEGMGRMGRMGRMGPMAVGDGRMHVGVRGSELPRPSETLHCG